MGWKEEVILGALWIEWIGVEEIRLMQHEVQTPSWSLPGRNCFNPSKNHSCFVHFSFWLKIPLCIFLCARWCQTVLCSSRSENTSAWVTWWRFYLCHIDYQMVNTSKFFWSGISLSHCRNFKLAFSPKDLHISSSNSLSQPHYICRPYVFCCWLIHKRLLNCTCMTEASNKCAIS